MSKTTYAINSFNGGEYSPLIYGRIDFDKRRSGAAVVENFLPLRQGPMTARPGTIYVNNVRISNNRTKLIPFEFNVNQTYIIEVGAYYFRFYKNHAPITGSAITVDSISKANPAVVRFSGGTLNNNDLIEITGGQMTEVNGTQYVAKKPTVVSTGISFVAPSTINITGSGFSVFSDMTAGDTFTIVGANNVANNATFTLATVAAGTITVSETSIVSETAGEKITLEFQDAIRLRTLDGDMDTYDGDVDSSGYTTYVSGGTVSFWGKHTPYPQSDLYDSDSIFDLGYAQSADTLYVTHKNHFPRKLVRNGDSDWSFEYMGLRSKTNNVPYFDDGPYLEENKDPRRYLLPVVGGAGVPVSTPNTELRATDNYALGTYNVKWSPFKSTDVGRIIRLSDATGQNVSYCVIVEYVSPTVVYVDPVGEQGTITSGAPGYVQYHQFGLYGAENGYPHRVTFFQDRLVFSGCPAAPQRIDFSKSGEYETFSPTTQGSALTVPEGDQILPDSAISIALQSPQVNIIKWILDDEKALLAGTEGGEWVIKSSNDGEAMTAENAQATQPSNYGSSNIPALRAGQGSLFVQRSFRKVREFAYSSEVFGYATPDMSQLAEHLTEGNILEMAYQREPHSIVWAVRGDGVLLGLTYDRMENVYGWHRHILGSTTVSGTDHPAVVESVACIASPDKDRDELWCVVKRYVDGAYVRHIEYFDKDWLVDRDRDQALAFQVDCGVKYSSPGTAILTGLDHLEGQEVVVFADGAAHPNKTVSSGQITVNAIYTNVAVGLKYTPAWESLEIESSDRVGQGKKKRINFMRLLLTNSLGGHLGRDSDNMDEILYRQPSDAMDTPVPLYSGYKFIDFNGDWSRESKVRFEQRQPFPLTITAAYIDVDTQDK